MAKRKAEGFQIKEWLAKDWVQLLVVAMILFTCSWLYMGKAITDCSTASTALGSDSIGGFGWVQWASGNDLSWNRIDKSNYPFGENPVHPQFITGTLFIVLFKIFATLTTPICGINLMILLGYMSTGLLMYGLIKWLLKRFDIALFAGFAAAFVPFHQLKSQSHVNYIYGSIFIALIWVYLWFISKPSYRRAVILGAVGSLGFYFDGYFVLISAIVIGGLFLSKLVFALLDTWRNRLKKPKAEQLKPIIITAKQLLVVVAVLGILLIPILVVYKTKGADIRQTLASVRSDIKTESITYGARPIEFLAPSHNSALLPSKLPLINVTQHGSNASESTLYIGYTLIILAGIGIIYAFRKKYRTLRFRNISYRELISTNIVVFLMCLAFSLPATVVIFSYSIPTPTDILVHLTANWRVLSRLFLAMHPAVVIVASLGLYLLVKRWSSKLQYVIVALCGLLLFLEYLPSPLHPTSDLYKDAPPIYKQIKNDKNVNLVAEYPITSFLYTPEIFTFQMMHNKTLLNANDGSISTGPFLGSIAGLNDKQTLGVLKAMDVDVLVTHGINADNPALTKYLSSRIVYSDDGSINEVNTSRYYKINSLAEAHDSILVVKKGYESLSVDANQISHRFVAQQVSLGVVRLKQKAAKQYKVDVDINSACPATAEVIVYQASRKLWQGNVGKEPAPIDLTISNGDFTIQTKYCAIDLTNLSAKAID